MQKKTRPGTTNDSFRAFISARRALVIAILFIAIALRLALAIGFPRPAGDETRYTVTAVNLLAGHGFTSDVAAPFSPSDHAMPLYPFFIAGVYEVFGEKNAAVRSAQSVLDLVTCLLVAFIAFQLAPLTLRGAAAISALILYGCLSWFTISWNRYVLTETLAMFLTMLAAALIPIAMRKSAACWFVVGAVCGLAVLTRPDSLLLVFAITLCLLIEIGKRQSRESILALLLFCSAIPLMLSPWLARNYLSLGKFQPLASEYAKPHGEYVPSGYILWIRTWMTDQTYAQALEPVFHPELRSFDPRQLPYSTFDSYEERQQVIELIDRFRQTGEFTPEMSDRFHAMAVQRIRNAPFRFFVGLPLRRIASMWLTGFATTNRLHMFARILLVIPILIGGALGLAFFVTNRPLLQVILAVIFTRTLFFGFYGSEERYIVEAYPLVVAACAVTCACAWQRITAGRARRLRADIFAD